MKKVFLSLGSNMGVRIENIHKVLSYFSNDKRFSEFKCSSIYETKPYGDIKQKNFLNCVILVKTEIQPKLLLKIVKNLEKKIGRKSRKRWGPREIDIDILLYEDLVAEYEHLSIPHKDILNRDFVLVPLLEIDDNLIYPGTQIKIKTFLNQLKDNFIISKQKFNCNEVN